MTKKNTEKLNCRLKHARLRARVASGRRVAASTIADLAGMPMLAPFSIRAEATGPRVSGIHRCPISSRDLAEHHARKVADMRVGAYPSTRARFPLPIPARSRKEKRGQFRYPDIIRHVRGTPAFLPGCLKLRSPLIRVSTESWASVCVERGGNMTDKGYAEKCDEQRRDFAIKGAIYNLPIFFS